MRSILLSSRVDESVEKYIESRRDCFDLIVDTTCDTWGIPSSLEAVINEKKLTIECRLWCKLKKKREREREKKGREKERQIWSTEAIMQSIS